MNKSATIFVAGHRGLVGSAIVRCLHSAGYRNVIVREHSELDLARQSGVEAFFSENKPQYVFLAAARVGGIYANNAYPADFIRDNLQIQTNVIDAAYRSGVQKLLFLGSSCIYPRLAAQPMVEDSLLTGALESTNQWYAIAKIAGLKMCQAYRRQYDFNAVSVLPTNLYGPGDNFSLQDSHVLPALIRKFHEGKEQKLPNVIIWGTGQPRREFLHVDDLAAASLFLMESYESEELINVGCGEDISIRELAELVAKIVGFSGGLMFDSSKPDGTPRKLLDVSRLNRMGWRPQRTLRDGIVDTYRWFLAHQEAYRC